MGSLQVYRGIAKIPNEVIFISGYDLNVTTDRVLSGVHTSERTLKKTEVVQQPILTYC